MKRSNGTYLAASAALIFGAACQNGAQPNGGSAPAAKGAPASGAKASATGDKSGMAAMEKPKGDQVQCLGIHECKGKSACHVAGGHACAGQNECKGKGWIMAPRAECDAKGGKVNQS